jgi:hypothetical protein
MKILAHIKDLDARSFEAGCILEPEEMKLAWSEVEISVEELPDEAAPATLSGWAWTCCHSFVEHQTRLEEIESWVTQVGGPELALIQAPLLLERGPVIIDGWHRLCVARKLGAKTVRALYVNQVLSDLVF